MYSNKQFAALEAMCREQAACARKEMEYSLMEYWLAEAEEWKQLKESLEPFLGRIANRSSDLASFCREMHFSAETSGFLAILLVRFCLIGTCV